MSYGIYTLANDVVYDHLVALLNSIEVNAGIEVPVVVIPYDSQLEKVKSEIASRKNVSLFTDISSIERWENFAIEAWKASPRAQKVFRERRLPSIYRLALHRKLCCLDGEFENFIYFDADTLLLGPIQPIYEKLDEFKWVTYDFQYKSDLRYVFDNINQDFLQKVDLERIKSTVFCSGLFAGRKPILAERDFANLLGCLKSGEADIMCLWCPDQALLNYLILRGEVPYYNFAYHQVEDATGCHWSSQFEVRDRLLYDRGKRLTYLHYMSLPAWKFMRLCQGEDIDIPYRDIFLYYRYLHSPEKRPNLTSPSWTIRTQRAVQEWIAQKQQNIKYRLQRFF